MNFKKGGEFFNKYGLFIFKVILACLALSVFTIGILAVVEQFAPKRSSQNVASQTTQTSASDSEENAGPVDSNVKDYVHSSSHMTDANEIADTDKGTDTKDANATSAADSPDTEGSGNTTSETADTQTDTSDKKASNKKPSDASEQLDMLDVSSSVKKELDSLSVEEKVAQLFFITPEQLTGIGCVIQAGDPTKQAIAKYPVGGLIYFAKNIKTEEQIKGMLSNIKSYSSITPFLGIDEEGGKVSRITESGLPGPSFDPMMTLGSSGDPATVEEAGSIIGEYLASLGFNLDFAPVCDVVSDPDHSSIATRSFGGDPEAVSEMAGAFASGLHSKHILSCMKHFPGLGNSSADSHTGTVTIEDTLDELRATDLVPYEEAIAAKAPFIMVGHASYPSISGDDTPASMSPAIITDLLRKEMGYTGVVITDALNMKAVSEYYTAEDAAVASILAGADMLLMPDDFQEAYEGVLAAVNDKRISKERLDLSVARILMLKENL